MLLRRITEHVKDQNWTAVALDFVIVVVGVFIGIQVSNWNGARNDRALELEYLQRLHDEAEHGLDGILANIDKTWTHKRDQALGVLAMISSTDETYFSITEAQCNALGFTSQIIAFPFQFPSLEELNTSGRFGLIREERIKRALTDYTLQQKNSASLVDYYSRGATPLATQFPSLIERRFRIENSVVIENYHCTPDLLSAHPEVINAAQDSIERFNGYYDGVLRPEIDTVERIHDLLEEELGLQDVENAQ